MKDNKSVFDVLPAADFFQSKPQVRAKGKPSPAERYEASWEKALDIPGVTDVEGHVRFELYRALSTNNNLKDDQLLRIAARVTASIHDAAGGGMALREKMRKMKKEERLKAIADQVLYRLLELGVSRPLEVQALYTNREAILEQVATAMEQNQDMLLATQEVLAKMVEKEAQKALEKKGRTPVTGSLPNALKTIRGRSQRTNTASHRSSGHNY